MFDGSTRKTIVACGVIGMCLIAYGIYRVLQPPHDGPLPRIVERVAPTPVDKAVAKVLPEAIPDRAPSATAAVPDNSRRVYEPRSQAELESWQKASDPSVPLGEVFAAVEMRVTRPNVPPLSDGTIVVSGTKEITVEGSFQIAEEILSLPPLAYFELVATLPNGSKFVIDSVRVTDLTVEGKKYTVRATVLRTLQTGKCRAVLEFSGRELAHVAVRFE